MVFSADIVRVLQSGLTFSVDGGRGGLSGLAGHYINFAFYSLMSVPLAYGAFKNAVYSHKKKWIFMYGFAIFILCISAVMSGSRGAVISFFTMIILVSVLELFSGGSKSIFALPLMLVSCLCILCFFWFKGGDQLMISLLALFSDVKNVDGSLSGRMSFNRMSFQLFLNNFIFGIGLGSTVKLLGHVTHNQWLQILSELGSFGFAIAGMITFRVFHCLVIAKRKFDDLGDLEMTNLVYGVMASIGMITVWGLYENIGLIAADKMLFMLFGVSAAMKHFAVSQTKST